MIGPTLSKTTTCAYRFFFYSFTASHGSGGTTASRVVSPRSIMRHHRFRSEEVRRAIKQNIDYVKHHTPHCWTPGIVMYPANSTKSFSWLTRQARIFIVEERSNIYIYIYLSYTVCVYIKQSKKYYIYTVNNMCIYRRYCI